MAVIRQPKMPYSQNGLKWTVPGSSSPEHPDTSPSRVAWNQKQLFRWQLSSSMVGSTQITSPAILMDGGAIQDHSTVECPAKCWYFPAPVFTQFGLSQGWPWAACRMCLFKLPQGRSNCSISSHPICTNSLHYFMSYDGQESQLDVVPLKEPRTPLTSLRREDLKDLMGQHTTLLQKWMWHPGQIGSKIFY